MKKILSLIRYFKWPAICLLVSLSLCYVTNFALTYKERTFLTSLIENVISSPNRSIRIYGINNPFSYHPHIDSISIADKNGIWLRLNQISLNWQPFDLLRGKLHIAKLDVSSIDFLRLPRNDGFSSSEAHKVSWSSFPLDIVLDKLATKVIRFSNHEGQHFADLQVEGFLAVGKHKLNSEISAKRLDGEGAFLLKALYDQKTKQLGLNLAANEPKNGLISTILQLPNRPSLQLKINSEGDMDKFLLKLQLLANQQQVVNGTLNMETLPLGKDFAINLKAKLADLIAKDYQPFFGDNSTLSLKGFAPKEGGLEVSDLQVQTPSLTTKAAASFLGDGFLRSLEVKAAVNPNQNMPLTLPFTNYPIRTKNLQLDIHYGQKNQNQWAGKFEANEIGIGTVLLSNLSLNMGGPVSHLDNPKKRYIGINLQGDVADIKPSQSVLAKIFSHQLKAKLTANLYGTGPLDIEEATLSSNGLNINFMGRMTEKGFNGDIQFEAEKLSKLSPLLGKSIQGSGFVKASGLIGLGGGGFRLDLSGNTKNLEIEDKALNPLFKDPLLLSGRIIRDSRGLTTRNVHLYNNSLSLFSNGVISSDKAFIDAELKLKNMVLLNKNLQGPLQIKFAGRGHNRFIQFALVSHIPNAIIQGNKLEDFTFTSNFVLDRLSASKNYISGLIDSKGHYAGAPLKFSANILDSAKKLYVKNLILNMKDANLSGKLSRDRNNLYEGNLLLDARNIHSFLGLFLLEGSGSIKAHINLEQKNNLQNGSISADSRELVIGKNVLKNLTLDASVQDIYQKFNLDGQIKLRELQLFYKKDKAEPLSIRNLAINAINAGDHTKFYLKSNFQRNANLTAQLTLYRASSYDTSLILKDLHLSDESHNVSLLAPAKFRFYKNIIDIENLRLKNNNGFASINGSISQSLNLQTEIKHFPLSTLNSFMPNFSLFGEASGKLKIKGTAQQPNINFELTGQNMTSPNLAPHYNQPVTLTTQGSFKNSTLVAYADLQGNNVAINAKGRLHFFKNFASDNNLDFNMNVKMLPVVILEKLLHIHGLSGKISGSLNGKGTTNNPYISYNLYSHNLGLDVLKPHGISLINATLNGEVKNQKVTIENLSLIAEKGLDAKASGQISLEDKSLDLKLKGSLPVEILNQYMTSYGMRIGGTLNVNSAVKGPWSSPNLFGNFQIQKGNFFETVTNINIININIKGQLENQTILLDNIYGQSRAGGTISGNGKILLDREQNFPAEFNANLDKYKYAYDTIVITTINAPLHIHGPLLHNPVIEGTVKLLDTEINVPRNIRNIQTIEVEHRHPTPAIMRTLNRAMINKDSHHHQSKEKSENILQLNLHILAPNHVFVRGSGLNAELGGTIDVTGPVTHIRPVGDLQLIRGRYDIGSKKINFDSGQLDFSGNIDPDITLTGQASAQDITVIAQVTGTITDLKMSFTSQPALPQDEILAHLLFNASINQLTPLQIAQLALAAAEISGLRHSVMNSLRAHTGMDDIDFLTDDKGYVGLKVGRYLKDNLYVGVEAGTNGKTKLDLNYNFTQALKAKGSYSVNGQSSFGLFFEKDY